MNLFPNKSKIILLGIIFLILNTFSGSSFDAVTKFLSSSSLIWYHYYAIGNSFALILLLIFLFFTSGIKKNIILENKESYFLPVIRGVIFIPIPIIVYYALNFIDLNIFTTILMTTPFFVYIFCFLTIPFTRHHHHLHYTHTLLRTSITGLASTCFWLARRPIFLSGVCKGNGVCLFFWAPNLFTFISVDSFSPFFVLRNSCFSSGSDQI